MEDWGGNAGKRPESSASAGGLGRKCGKTAGVSEKIPGHIRILETELRHREDAVVADPVEVGVDAAAVVAGAVLDDGVVVLEGELHLAEVVGEGGGDAHHLVDVLESVAAEVVQFVVEDGLAAGEAETLHVADHAETLEFLADRGGDETDAALGRSVFIGDAVRLEGRGRIAAVELHVLAALDEGALGLDLPVLSGVLQEDERVEGGEPLVVLLVGLVGDRLVVGDFDLVRIAVRVVDGDSFPGNRGRGGGISVVRADAQRGDADAAEETAGLEGQAEVGLREDGVALVFVGAAVRSAGAVLHLLDEAGREGYVFAEVGVVHDLRATVERGERGAGLEGDRVGQVGRERMPGLADEEAVGEFLGRLPGEFGVGLPHPEGRDVAARVEAVEVGLDLGLDGGAAELVTFDVESEAGGEGLVAEVADGVDVGAVHETLVERDEEEEVFGEGFGGAGIVESVGADEAVGLEVGLEFFLHRLFPGGFPGRLVGGFLCDGVGGSEEGGAQREKHKYSFHYLSVYFSERQI